MEKILKDNFTEFKLFAVLPVFSKISKKKIEKK